MLQSYQVKDSPTKKEQPLIPTLIRIIRKRAKSQWDTLISELIMGVFFFAMRGYEYTKTLGLP